MSVLADRDPLDISVAMATYNGADYIERQLESIVSQTVRPFEIVITDDGSTDSTIEKVEAFSARSPVPIKVHKNDQRLGYADNFLKAAALTEGPYVAFSDQDDVWYPKKLEVARNLLTNQGMVLVSHQMNRVDASGKFLSLDRHGAKISMDLNPCGADPLGVFFGFTMTFDRRLLEIFDASDRGMDPFDPTMVVSHDRWVYFLGTTFGRAFLLAEPLADYRQHNLQTFGVRGLSFWGRFKLKLTGGRDRVAGLDAIFKHRLSLIRGARDERVRSPQGSFWPSVDSLRRAEAYWSKLSRYSARRVATYRTKYCAGRFLHLVINLGCGAYLSETGGGLGHRHFLEDLVTGVFGPYLRGLFECFDPHSPDGGGR